MPKGIYKRTHFETLVGQKFGKLLVVSRDGEKNRHQTYKCFCDCGKERNNVIGSDLKRGKTKSCGCDYPTCSKGSGLSESQYFEHTKERLLAKREIQGSCWLWTGIRTNKGYGFISWGQGKEKRKQTVHRIAYTIWNGKIPENLWVLHKCDNRRCFNPEHLFLGTAQDNMDDKMQKGRDKCGFGESSGMAKLSECDILLIRKYRENGKTLKEIAKEFSVTDANISDICLRHTWRHI